MSVDRPGSFVSGLVLWRDHAFEDLGSRSNLLYDLRKLVAGIVVATGLLCGRAQQRRECAVWWLDDPAWTTGRPKALFRRPVRER
jgi:hypothetical protein